MLTFPLSSWKSLLYQTSTAPRHWESVSAIHLIYTSRHSPRLLQLQGRLLSRHQDSQHGQTPHPVGQAGQHGSGLTTRPRQQAGTCPAALQEQRQHSARSLAQHCRKGGRGDSQVLHRGGGPLLYCSQTVWSICSNQ